MKICVGSWSEELKLEDANTVVVTNPDIVVAVVVKIPVVTILLSVVVKSTVVAQLLKVGLVVGKAVVVILLNFVVSIVVSVDWVSEVELLEDMELVKELDD